MNTEQTSDHKLELRNLRSSDYEDIREIMERVYRVLGEYWTREEFASHLARFPQGQICIEDRGKVVAAALSLIIDFSRYGENHTYHQIVGEGHLKNHDPDGDYLYGIEVFVNPDYQGMRLGRRIYDARKEICENLNLKGILLGGRIPGYRKVADEMTPQQYIQMVKSKEIHDPVLTFQLANDFHIKKLIKNYMPEDRESLGYAVLLEWNNIYFEDRTPLMGAKKTYVRLGVVQWQMRLFESFEHFRQQVEFFVDTVARYHADIVLFPELFNAPLIAEFDQEYAPEAMRSLAEYTEPLRRELVNMALSYNINIVSGSIPEYTDNKLYNISFLCRRDGTWEKQYKLHITPEEYQSWGLRGGSELKVFETDVGKIGILICYDIEFPELPRILAEQGMNILLVPYWTDTQNAYLRVRRCAQARAVENECYVAISGSVGNIPRVENMDIQYSQSAVFTPSDFAFPHDGIAAEATPNTEMALIADLDLDLLKELREQGSVCNLSNRRLDLYNLLWVSK
ncbi:MAG: GNAT family N-acetyltransferase [Desulfohalobiaceae bacterium]|nr:GNAT family N-acetyltransferase [Desulfohalobiaceae bacterium]